MLVTRAGRKVGTLSLRVPGRHNAQNALAALAVCGELGFDLRRAIRGLGLFAGVGRRMERLGEAEGILFYDDYGHHPTEVRATLAAARGMAPGRRLVVLFQPHRYSRTRALHREFGPAFRGADLLFVAPIYPAGEKKLRGIDAGLVLAAARRAGLRAAAYERAVDLARVLRRGDLVLTIGAGDVWKIGLDLLRRIGGRTLGSV